jgi:hypothetical protein
MLASEHRETDDLATLTDRLSALLEEETALLDSLDLTGAAALLSRKRDAVAALQAAMMTGPVPAGLDAGQATALCESIARMAALGEANRVAIERGVALQTRMIQAIATAVPRARAVEAPVYQPDGSKMPARPPEAYAFLSRM